MTDDAVRVGLWRADPPRCHRYPFGLMSTGVIAILLPRQGTGQGVASADLSPDVFNPFWSERSASRGYRPERPVEREQPDVVALRRGREHVSGRVRDDVLLAVVREHAD